jgi:serine/threonine-protein kinase 24/25/MST4
MRPFSIGFTANHFRNTLSLKDDDDEWVFDTVKAPTMAIPKETLRRRKLPAIPLECPEEQETEMSQGMEDLHIESPINARPVANSTVRRTTGPERSPSVKRANSKRKSSGVKQPLGLNLSFGNSPSTVRQFRRTSDKLADDDGQYSPFAAAMDENIGQKTLFSENNSKEAQLGRRAYNKAVGLSCQEILANTSDQEKREAISRLAEAWSDLEMIDPEGLYHIVKLMNDKIQG